jgi:hypothetical protein
LRAGLPTEALDTSSVHFSMGRHSTELHHHAGHSHARHLISTGDGGNGNCGQKLNRNGNDCHPNPRRQSSLWYHGTIYGT